VSGGVQSGVSCSDDEVNLESLLDQKFREYQKACRQQDQAHQGPRAQALLNLLSRREVSLSKEDVGETGFECLSAGLDALEFADLWALLREQNFPDYSPELLANKAAILYDAFVKRIEEAQLRGHFGPASALWSSPCRNALATCFAFPLMGQAAADAIAEELRKLGVSRVWDVMAGTGLHARLLTRAGLSVVASDVMPSEKIPHVGAGWFPIAAQTAEAVFEAVDDGQKKPEAAAAATGAAGSSSSALFLAWPPRTPAALGVLKLFPGDVLVYVGDSGAWNGCASFHEELSKHWLEVRCIEIPSWPHTKDSVRIYRRLRAGQSL